MIGIRYTCLLSWLAVAVLTSLCSSALAAPRVALVIGNAAYAHASTLANPLNDAADVGAALGRLGFAVTRIENADQAALRRGLQEFALAASASQVAVVYYAGHGIEVDQRNYLVPVDARLASDQDVEFETVPMELVSRAVARASGLRLVILDACRENPFAVSMQRSGATRSIGRGLARVEPSGETLVAFAAKGGTVALDGSGRNSPYSEAMLRFLEEPGLEVGLMFRKVRDAVVATTGGRQEPFVYGSLSSRGVYLSAPPSPAPSLASATQPSAAGESGSGTLADDREDRFWESVKDSDDPADVQVFLDRYPDGTYAELARNRLKRIERSTKDMAPSESTPKSSSIAARLEEARLAAEREFWGMVKESGIRSDLEAFLEQYPDGVYAPLARIRLRQLQRDRAVPQAVASPTEDSTPKDSPAAPAPVASPLAAPASEEAESSLSLSRSERRRIQRALAYLELYSGLADGLFGKRTRSAIRGYQKEKVLEETGYLTGEQAEALLGLSGEANRRADDAAFAQAKAEDTLASYGEYLQSFSEGRHVTRARERVSALRAEAERVEAESRRKRAERDAEARKVAKRRADDAAFAQAELAGTLESYGEYLQSYSDGRHEAQARERVAALQARSEALDETQWQAGHRFRDCARCPEMVVIPAGSYPLRSLDGMEITYQGRVTIAEPLAVGVHEVTFEQWDACRRAGGCSHNPGDEGWGRGNRPAINVNWKDAQEYAHWLSSGTGRAYRLLSEFEWEFAARGGTATHFSWGKAVGRNRANCEGCGSRWDDEQTSPVGSFPANAYGLRDAHGNVREWVEDCWSRHTYHIGLGPIDGPMDGSPRLARHGGDCSRRIVRGGSWNSIPRDIRSAKRGSFAIDQRRNDTGFRVARTLD